MNNEVKKKGRPSTNSAALKKIYDAGTSPVIMKKKEWKIVTPPGRNNLRKYLKKEYIVMTLEDESGWIIKRKQ